MRDILSGCKKVARLGDKGTGDVEAGIDVKIASNRIDLYRGMYWANQGLLNAVHALHEVEGSSSSDSSKLLNHELRRTQAIIEETRIVMNHILSEWIEGKE